MFVEGPSFHGAVFADLPVEVADMLARTQRPASLDAFTTFVTGTSARKTQPSWAIVATADRAIHP